VTIDLHLRKLSLLFEEALAIPVQDREAFVRSRCADDAGLLDEMLRLLHKDQVLEREGLDSESGLGVLSKEAFPEFFLEGQQVGSFRVGECIGSGGMGTVYRVSRVDGQVEQEAALKLLHPFASSSALVGRFNMERRVLASLVHRSISRFLDAGTLPDGRPYVLMEMINGTPLLEYCDSRRLDFSARLNIFLKVVQAVAFAHGRLVVHRDIKSKNILVSVDDEPKLLDFGIAKILDGVNMEVTRTSERFFTPTSAAPEQLLGEPIGVGCDIYALGQLLYEVLSGQAPFDFSGASVGSVERAIVEQPPPPMAVRCRSTPPEKIFARGFSSVRDLSSALRGDLEAIVLKCLRKRPEERYISAEQLEQEIRRVLDQRPVQARGDERWYRLKKHLARNRTPVALGTVIVVTLVLSLAIMVFQAMKVTQQRGLAELERDRTQHAVLLLQEAIISADPSRVAGGDVTARQIMQSTRPLLDQLFDSQPLLFASLAAVISEVEIELSLTEAAAEMADRGIAAGLRAGIPEKEMRVLLLHKAKALLDLNDFEAGAQILSQVRQTDQVDQPDWLDLKGRYFILQNKPERALTVLEAALLGTAGYSPENRVAVSIRWQLAHLRSMLGMHNESVATYAETLTWMKTGLSDGHPLITLTRLWRLDALRRAGRLEDARGESIVVEQQVRTHFGEDSSMAGRMHATFGMLASVDERYDDAAAHYRSSVGIWQRLLSADHPHILRVKANLAHLLETQDGYEDEVEALYRSVLEIAGTQTGATSRTTTAFRVRLARFLIGQHRGNEALELLVASEVVMNDSAAKISAFASTLEDSVRSADCNAYAPSIAADISCRRAVSWLEGFSGRTEPVPSADQ